LPNSTLMDPNDEMKLAVTISSILSAFTSPRATDYSASCKRT
jgi:hypothetical protein